MRPTRSCGNPLCDDGFLRMLRDHASPARGRALRVRPQRSRQPLQRQARDLGDIEARQTSPTAIRGAAACRGRAGIRCSPCTASTRFFINALSVFAKVCSTYRLALGEGALVARLFLAFERAPHLVRRRSRHTPARRLLVGEQDPVAILLRQLAPGAIDVVAERDQDVAQVLAVPGGAARRRSRARGWSASRPAPSSAR